MKKIKVISCIATVAMMALIFFFSSQTASVSSQTSSGITRMIAEFITKLIKGADVEAVYQMLHTIVRKAAHFALFCLLAISVANTIFQLYGIERLKLLAYSLCFCLLYAITDEVHQIFVPGRAAMIMDILIDIFGSLCGSGLFVILRHFIKRRKNHGM